MLLDLSKIIQTPDSELPFRTELDLHDLEFGGNYPVQEPVLAEGRPCWCARSKMRIRRTNGRSC